MCVHENEIPPRPSGWRMLSRFDGINGIENIFLASDSIWDVCVLRVCSRLFA